jgi:hypothetical protein
MSPEAVRYSCDYLSIGGDPLVGTWLSLLKASSDYPPAMTPLVWSSHSGWMPSSVSADADRFEDHMLDCDQLVSSIESHVSTAHESELRPSDRRSSCGDDQGPLSPILYWTGIAVVGNANVIVVETLQFVGFLQRFCSATSGHCVDVVCEVARPCTPSSRVVIPFEQLGSGVLLTAKRLPGAIRSLQTALAQP